MPRSSSHSKQHQHITQGKPAISRRSCKSLVRDMLLQDHRVPSMTEHQALACLRASNDARLLLKPFASPALHLHAPRRKNTPQSNRHDAELDSLSFFHAHWLIRGGERSSPFSSKVGGFEDLGEKSRRHARYSQNRAKDAQKRHHLERQARRTRDRRRDMHLDIRLAVSEHEKGEEGMWAAPVKENHHEPSSPSALDSDDDVEIIDGFSSLELEHCTTQSQADRTIAALTFAIANGACTLDDSPRPKHFGGLLDTTPPPSHQTEASSCAGDLWH